MFQILYSIVINYLKLMHCKKNVHVIMDVIVIIYLKFAC